MKLNKLSVTLALLALSSVSALGWQFSTRQSEAQAQEISGEGFGRDTIGGQGGTVYTVTDSGDTALGEPLRQGTLRWAMDQPGPKIVAFAVPEVRLIRPLYPRRDRASYTTIDGATAPGGAVTIMGNVWVANYGSSPIVQHVIVRGIRFRGLHTQDLSYSVEGNGDNLSIYGVVNVLVEQSSFSGSHDESIGVGGGSDLITIRDCIIAESAIPGQGDQAHPKGRHNRAIQFAYNATGRASLIQTLIVNHETRFPDVHTWGEVEVINVYAFNPDKAFGQIGGDDGPSSAVQKAAILGNVFRRGPSDGGGAGTIYRYLPATTYVNDNRYLPNPGDPNSWLINNEQQLWQVATPFFDPVLTYENHTLSGAVTALPSGQLLDYLIANAGAHPLDATDRRIIAEIQAGEGGFGIRGPFERFPQTPGDGTTVNVTANVSGSGQIETEVTNAYWQPGQINTFNKGSSAIMRAVPSEGETFTGWVGGAADGLTEPEIEVTFNETQTITATFGGVVNQPPVITTAQDTYTLTYGDTLSIPITATDPDSLTVTITAPNLNTELPGAGIQ